MTCDNCLKDNIDKLIRRNDDLNGSWYCSECFDSVNKRIWQTKRNEALINDKAIVKAKK